MSGAAREVGTAPREDAPGTLLRSPGVGWYGGAPPPGRVLRAGEACGWLETLGQRVALRLPADAHGVVCDPPPARRRTPVAWGQTLLRLDPLTGEVAAADVARAGAAQAGERVLRAPQPGRFWRRPSPAEPVFVEAGDEVEEGRSVGLLEVMKTFQPVKYRAGGPLPPRGRIARFLAEDGEDVDEGQPLLEIEP